MRKTVILCIVERAEDRKSQRQVFTGSPGADCPGGGLRGGVPPGGSESSEFPKNKKSVFMIGHLIFPQK